MTPEIEAMRAQAAALAVRIEQAERTARNTAAHKAAWSRAVIENAHSAHPLTLAQLEAQHGGRPDAPPPRHAPKSAAERRRRGHA